MLDVRTSDKGAVYLYNKDILLTFVKSKQEINIPCAKIKIYSQEDISKLLLRAVFLYTTNKNKNNLIFEINRIGIDYEFKFDTGVGSLDSSIKLSDKELM